MLSMIVIVKVSIKLWLESKYNSNVVPISSPYFVLHCRTKMHEVTA